MGFKWIPFGNQTWLAWKSYLIVVYSWENQSTNGWFSIALFDEGE